MSLTIGRVITLVSWGSRLMAEADEAGPSIKKLMEHAVALADLLDDPGVSKLVKSLQELTNQLELGGVEPSEVVTPREAIERIAAGEITAEEQRRFDRETQQSGL